MMMFLMHISTTRHQMSPQPLTKNCMAPHSQTASHPHSTKQTCREHREYCRRDTWTSHQPPSHPSIWRRKPGKPPGSPKNQPPPHKNGTPHRIRSRSRVHELNITTDWRSEASHPSSHELGQPVPATLSLIRHQQPDHDQPFQIPSPPLLHQKPARARQQTKKLFPRPPPCQPLSQRQCLRYMIV